MQLDESYVHSFDQILASKYNILSQYMANSRLFPNSIWNITNDNKWTSGPTSIWRYSPNAPAKWYVWLHVCISIPPSVPLAPPFIRISKTQQMYVKGVRTQQWRLRVCVWKLCNIYSEYLHPIRLGSVRVRHHGCINKLISERNSLMYYACLGPRMNSSRIWRRPCMCMHSYAHI